MIDEDRPGHTHRLPRAVLLTLIIICAGLLASLVLVYAFARQAQHQAEMTDQRLEALEGFIADRGEVRDEQYMNLDSRITKAICGVLDGLPAGGLLDPIREEYGCGPGVPLDELPAAAAEQLQQFSSGIPSPRPAVKPSQPAPETTDAPSPTPTAAPPPVVSVQPAAPTPVPGSPAVPPAPAPPAPAAPPLVDLTPITDPLCTGLGLCL